VDPQVADASTNLGLLKVGIVVFGLALTLLAANGILISRNSETSVGHWAQAWARRYPMFALATSFFFGALIGHFFCDTWNPG